MYLPFSFFRYGFANKGFNSNEVGVDLVQLYSSPATWKEGSAGEKEVGTPVVRNLAADGLELKVCPDGEVPEGYLTRRVGEGYSLEEMMYVENKMEVTDRYGEPTEFMVHRANGVIATKLLAEGYTPEVGDELYVDGGKFTDTDPTEDTSGKVIGKVINLQDFYGEIFAEFILY